MQYQNHEQKRRRRSHLGYEAVELTQLSIWVFRIGVWCGGLWNRRFALRNWYWARDKALLGLYLKLDFGFLLLLGHVLYPKEICRQEEKKDGVIKFFFGLKSIKLLKFQRKIIMSRFMVHWWWQAKSELNINLWFSTRREFFMNLWGLKQYKRHSYGPSLPSLLLLGEGRERERERDVK